VNFPNTNQAVRQAALVYRPNVSEAQEAYDEAISHKSIALLCVHVEDALKDHIDDLDADGLRILAGACHLIALAGWWNRTLSSAATMMQATSLLEAIVGEDDAETPSPVAGQ
jgi:hypothetical protein